MTMATEGQWEGVIDSPGDSDISGDGLGVFPMHAALLKDGRILMFAGHVESRDYLLESYVWDPEQPATSATRQPFPTTTDLFCCHLAALDDGRILVVGGAKAGPPHGKGIKAITVFDSDAPDLSAWEKIGELNEPRWYPTVVKLPDGRFVTFSGRTDTTSLGIAKTVELFEGPYDGPSYGTTIVVGGDMTYPTYPGLHLVPGGRIFHTGTTWRYEGLGANPIGTFSFRMTGPSSGTWVDHGVSPHVDFREEGMSVLLSPAQDGKILLVGGAKASYSQTGFSSLEAGSEAKSAEILDTKATPPVWTRLADMAHPRINVTAVLLPDGKVLVLGGHNSHKFEVSHTPSNQAEIYDPVLDTWTSVATMNANRMYHSTALLMPDGRVWTGAGYDPDGDRNNKNMEFYKPPYFFNGPRPTITAVTNDDGPDGQMSYGRSIRISTPDPANIGKVVLMRPGAITHHTDSEQRSVPLDWVPSGLTELKAAVVSDSTVAPPGYYMVWIVDKQNRPSERAEFVRLTPQRCRVVTDRSTFSEDEVAGSGSTNFPASFYVIMEGFLPAELGITTATPTPAALAAIAPSTSFLKSDNTAFATISATPEELLVEIPSLPAAQRQRFTFRYSVQINGTADFFEPNGTTKIETQDVRLAADGAGYTCEGHLMLTHQPNPYMLDGATHWLSTDLRVFQIKEGESRFGQTVGSTDASALSFLENLLNNSNGSESVGNANFAGMSTDQQSSRLELSRSVGGKRVFNFAIAQVRYRGASLPANDVRVFFRAFTTTATGLAFNESTTYRRLTNVDGDPIPGLGLAGGELATIPFFGEARVNTSVNSMTAQRDTINKLSIASGSTESHTYFGCWLDFNQTSLRFPNYPAGNGPWATGLKSIQQLIRGAHQCLVAEVHFASDPIPHGATPGNHDNLAQRNLAIVESDNPGGVATRTVQHTFTVKPSADPIVAIPATLATATEHGGRQKAPELLIGDGVDQLMFEWGTLSPATSATLYLPDVDIEDLLSLDRHRGHYSGLQDIGDNTIEVPVGEVTYIPLPGGRSTNIPALLTLQLPEESRLGTNYSLLVRQIDGITDRMTGTVELFIPIVNKPEVLAQESNRLAVFRHIAESLPAGDRWVPIFTRMLGQMAERVDALGGNSAEIEPSPDGADARKSGISSLQCRIFQILTIALIATFVVLFGALSGTEATVSQVGVGIALVVVVVVWQLICRPTLLMLLLTAASGAALGGALSGVMVLADWGAGDPAAALAWSAFVTLGTAAFAAVETKIWKLI